MRIAFLTPEYVTPDSADGGLANYLKKTAGELARSGNYVSVFVMSRRNAIWLDGDVQIIEVGQDHFSHRLLACVPFVKRFVPLLRQVTAARRLARRFWEFHQQTPFDVIQSSSFRSPGFFLLRNGKVPLVCRVSSHTPTLRAAFGRKANLGERISDWMEMQHVRKADACFAPSRLLARAFSAANGREPMVLRTPVDFSAIVYDKVFFAQHRPAGRYLLFFGTLSRIKGVDLLAKVLPAVFEQYNDVSMVFIGRDDGLPNGDKLFPLVQTACGRHADRLQYYPSLDKARLYPFIEAAEAVVIPSRIDNYPNACLEAHLHGVPVVGTYGSSLDEMIEDGMTGFLAMGNDPHDLRLAIERSLAMSPVEREAMRSRIARHVEAIKHEDRIGQLLQLYQAAIAGFRQKDRSGSISRS